MKLGTFSISLTVNDITASEQFYAALGFSVIGGDAEQGWLILRNESCTLGLFKGMLERNTLTFNPGWDAAAQPLEAFTDIRDIQKQLQAQGITPQQPIAEGTSGPASLIVVDPDGNPILLDQHV